MMMMMMMRIHTVIRIGVNRNFGHSRTPSPSRFLVWFHSVVDGMCSYFLHSFAAGRTAMVMYLMGIIPMGFSCENNVWWNPEKSDVNWEKQTAWYRKLGHPHFSSIYRWIFPPELWGNPIENSCPPGHNSRWAVPAVLDVAVLRMPLSQNVATAAREVMYS